MKKNDTRLFVMATIAFTLAVSGLHAQMFDARISRLLIGTQSITPLYERDTYRTLLPWHFPPSLSLALEQDWVITLNNTDLHLISGTQYTHWGYKKEIAPDSVYGYRLSTIGMSLGGGVTFFDLLSDDGRFPVSFFVYGFFRLGLFEQQSWNDAISPYSVFGDFGGTFPYGLGFRTHLTLWDGPWIGLSVHYGLEMPVVNRAGALGSVKYRSLTNSIGIAITLENPFAM